MDDDTQSMGMDTSAAQPPMQPAGPAQQTPVPVPMQPPAQQTPVVPAQQDPLESHPAVQNASILRKVAEKIAGGDRIKTTYNPEDGSVKRERVPLSGSQMLMGILANVLGGAGHIASNESARMKGRATDPNFQLPTQAAQQQQDAQAREDYDQQQQAKVRKAQILKANMEAMRTAYSIGKENDEQKDKIVSNHADDLAQWSNTGAVQDNNVPSDQLMQRGYDPSKYIAVPDGKVAVFKPDGARATDSNGVPISQLTYSVIDGTTQAPLSQAKFDKLVQYGLQKQGAGSTIPEGATISSAVLAQMNHKIDLIDQTQNELDKAIGPDKVNVLDKIKENPGLIKAIEAYHNDGSSTEVDNQINNLQAKNPQAAGLMRSLVGKDELEKLKEGRESRIAAGKTAANETARVTAEEATPTGKAKAAKEAQQLTNEKLEATKKGLEIKKLQNEAPTQTGAHGPLQNGVDTTYLNSLPVEKQRTIQAVMDGRIPYTPQALRTAIGTNFTEVLTSAFPGDDTHPGFDATKAHAYEKLRQDYTSGKAFQRIQASNNALGHLNQYLQASQTIGSTFPGVKTLSGAGIFGKEAQDKAKQMQATIEFIAEETAKATKGGVPDKGEVERIRGILENWTPGAAQSSAKAVAQILKTPLDSLQSGWESGMPYGSVSPLRHTLSPEAVKAYTNLTGERPSFVQSGPAEVNPKSQAAPPNQGRPVIVNGKTVGYTTDGKTMTPAQ